MTDDILVYPAIRVKFRPSDADRRRRLIGDALSWLVVALLHFVFFLVLVISLQQRQERVGRRSAIETILDLSLLNRNSVPLDDQLRREESNEPDLSAKPLTVIPRPPVIEQENAPATPGDVLKSIGEALACGASNFEYLNKAQQARCPRQPWMAARRPDGTIVLDAPAKAPLQLQLTGADQLRKQAQTENPCPIMLNTPCVHPAPNLFDSSRGGLLPGLLGDGN